ncbi:MAG TPA: chemotaxis response regulator protein-glutamate methylesterase [Candidatus Acidoferrales bacterium]|nr:chemotaxis response regulator protein-glutamate methylesterase [Candidatus Acidoferrales bacterium]
MNATAKKIRVLLVDDSSFMRKVLQAIISSDPQMEVVGQAKDGNEAVAMAQSLNPDVITMDINMPRADGLQATEQIMSQNPRPIVIVSSETRDGAASTLVALELGAIDFISKPSSGIDLDMNSVGAELNRKLKMAAKVHVVRTATRPKANARGICGEASATPTEGPVSNATNANRFPVVVIAASTGGPAAVMQLVAGIAKDLPGAVVLVQHMPASFTSQFAIQLANAAEIQVKEAVANEALAPATFYICPGSHHIRVSPKGRIVLDSGARISGYRPCADVAMETAAEWAGPLTTGVVLTGMGNDGSRGARAIYSGGGAVFVQDEATSVIFGMPAEVIKTGFVTQVLPLDQIAAAIEKRVRQLASMSQVVLR